MATIFAIVALVPFGIVLAVFVFAAMAVLAPVIMYVNVFDNLCLVHDLPLWRGHINRAA